MTFLQRSILILFILGAIVGLAINADKTPADPAFNYNYRGELFIQKNEPAKAMADFRRAIASTLKHSIVRNGVLALPPKEASVYAAANNNIGQIYAGENDPSTAIDYFRRAILYDPKTAKYYNNLGAALSHLGRTDEANANTTIALSLDPQCYEAWLNRGKFFHQRGDSTQALKSFHKAIQTNPSLAEGYMQAGQIYFEQKNLMTARNMLIAAVVADPDNAQALYNLGIINFNTGDKTRGEELMRVAIKKWLSDPKINPIPGFDPKDTPLWAERLKVMSNR